MLYGLILALVLGGNCQNGVCSNNCGVLKNTYRQPVRNFFKPPVAWNTGTTPVRGLIFGRRITDTKTGKRYYYDSRRGAWLQY